MATKRTVVVELMGQRLTLKTTEAEEALTRNVARLQNVLTEIRHRTETVDTVRLFALGLLHLGRELDMMEQRYETLTGDLVDRLERWNEQVRVTLGEARA